jgi:hypothetical protein
MGDPYGHWKNERLLASQAESQKPYWNELYKQFFPTMVSSSLCDGDSDMVAQEHGIDRIIYLRDGKKVLIDEKWRSKDWGDIALEMSSSVEHQRPGWIEKDSWADFICYHTPSKTYMLNTHQLKNAWQRNKDKWVKLYRAVWAKNARYTSLSYAVPVAVLFLAMAQVNIIG